MAQIITLPIIHLGGTSRGNLSEQYIDAINALEAGLKALGEVSPNGRDYPRGPESHTAAVTEHCARMDKIRGVIAELRIIESHVARSGA